MLRRALTLAVALGTGCGDGQGSNPIPQSRLLLEFGAGCDGGCDVDISCIEALSIRVWSETGGERETCLTGDDLDGVTTGCSLRELDLVVPTGAPASSTIVALVQGFSGDAPDCAPREDEPARLLFSGISPAALLGEGLYVPLGCTAGCAAPPDGCDDVDCDDDSTCCAGVCANEDAMLHCVECFTPCDPWRADSCNGDECLCGDDPPCGANETCCAGRCVGAGTCAELLCPFESEDGCLDPASDREACGGGGHIDSCGSGADGCVGGGCVCGGGPECPSGRSCDDGDCG
ncbi:MAG: hypothetical protein HYY06_25350 [Deltaproteobacteria bacterium]|nr:hypothetical protein [Deltaproteobacteria bacterium]